jgi:hypothetical protein
MAMNATQNIQHAHFELWTANKFRSGDKVTINGIGIAQICGQPNSERGYTVRIISGGQTGSGYWDHDLNAGWSQAWLRDAKRRGAI